MVYPAKICNLYIWKVNLQCTCSVYTKDQSLTFLLKTAPSNSISESLIKTGQEYFNFMSELLNFGPSVQSFLPLGRKAIPPSPKAKTPLGVVIKLLPFVAPNKSGCLLYSVHLVCPFVLSHLKHFEGNGLLPCSQVKSCQKLSKTIRNIKNYKLKFSKRRVNILC